MLMAVIRLAVSFLDSCLGGTTAILLIAIFFEDSSVLDRSCIFLYLLLTGFPSLFYSYPSFIFDEKKFSSLSPDSIF